MKLAESSETVATTGPDVALAASGLRKAFGETRALRGCDLTLYAGEVHVLVGENGSGKSTLVKILGGVHAPDAGGRIEVGGVSVTRFTSPRDSRARGIAVVYQEVASVADRSVLDNLWLGAGGLLRGRSAAEKRSRGQETLDRLLGRTIDLSTRIGDLPLSDRQAVSIARALLTEPRVLILDEATSALDVTIRDRLFDMLRELCVDGVAVVIITHRMDEVEEIGDRITVLRSGENVGVVTRGWTRDQMVAMMTGDDQLTGHAFDRHVAVDDAPVVLRVSGADSDSAPAEDLQIRRGELIGLAGLEGQGQDAFLRSLGGLASSAGVVERVDDAGERHVITSPRDAARHGIAYLPKDRAKDVIFPWMSILDNFGIPTMRSDRVGAIVSDRRTRSRFAEYATSLKIKYHNDANAITTLSGGNQQKVLIARWLATAPKILLLDDPTRGIDIGAKRDLYRLLDELTAQGTTVVMLSTEVDELVELMDRVFVFRDNAISAAFERGQLTPQTLVDSYFGKAG